MASIFSFSIVFLTSYMTTWELGGTGGLRIHQNTCINNKEFRVCRTINYILLAIVFFCFILSEESAMKLSSLVLLLLLCFSLLGKNPKPTLRGSCDCSIIFRHCVQETPASYFIFFLIPYIAISLINFIKTRLRAFCIFAVHKPLCLNLQSHLCFLRVFSKLY